jgi:hypothetical protein
MAPNTPEITIRRVFSVVGLTVVSIFDFLLLVESNRCGR